MHKPKQVRLKCITARSISHKPQEARFKCKNIPRAISHIPKQVGFKCSISRCISHIPNQARFKCSIPRSISHKPQKARFKCNIPRSISHKAVMHLSIPAAPSPPRPLSGLLRGICPPCQSRGSGICRFCANPGANSELLTACRRFPIRI